MSLLEEGAVFEGNFTASGQYYDPELEWPGDTAYFESPSTGTEHQTYIDHSRKLRSGQPTFRLLVLRSSVLPKKQRIAVIDAYPEIQIGRDVQPEGSTTPRIRLKEMEVSKFHATIYWDGARKEWNLVDMGSMHGTYVRAGPTSADSASSATRLSPARAASMPRRLRHSDQLTIGGTVFEIHIHDNQRRCQDCTVTGQEEIPLFPSKKSGIKRTRDVAGIDSGASALPHPLNVDKDPKRALNTLKRSLLTRHDVLVPSSSASTSTSVEKQPGYVDRAARRRLLHPASRPDTPGLPTVYLLPSSQPESSAFTKEALQPKPIVSAPATPLPPTNIGHRLLMQQGWAPGNALGAPCDPSDDRVGLINPIELKHSDNRAGLGSKRQSAATDTEGSTAGLSWKDKEKFKRFKLQTL